MNTLNILNFNVQPGCVHKLQFCFAEECRVKNILFENVGEEKKLEVSKKETDEFYRDANGKYRCVRHNKAKEYCRECIGGGNALCKAHGIKKSFCKDCGGGGLCKAHGIRKSICKECGGGGLCKVHGIIKSECKKCDGSSFCKEHGMRKSLCKDCGGGALCKAHGIIKNRCRECNIDAFCKAHGIIKARCKKCVGSEFCKAHGIKKTYCKECGGNGLCRAHGMRKDTCKECMTSDQIIKRKIFCIGCLSKYLSQSRIKAGIRLCAECDKRTAPRTEVIVREKLLPLVNFPPSVVDNSTIGGTECDSGKRRPDLAWIGENRAIFVEIDENGGHPDNTTSCELAKVSDQSIAYKKQYGEDTRVFMLRYNPDAFDGFKITYNDRIQVLADKINELMVADMSKYESYRPYVGYYFYHSKCRFHIEAAMEEKDAIIVFRDRDVNLKRKIDEVDES